ncbi:hypothetical protein L3i23_06120 [Herbiconiux sp. L3-i23]|nr:hypothetical protein L3i23_06120 [Herbiconiux sp. L3-i23]
MADHVQDILRGRAQNGPESDLRRLFLLHLVSGHLGQSVVADRMQEILRDQAPNVPEADLRRRFLLHLVCGGWGRSSCGPAVQMLYVGFSAGWQD